MLRRLLYAALALGVLCPPAFAQSYSATPIPRTTDPAALRASATAREVHERFARALAAMSRNDWTAARDESMRIIALDPPEPRGSTARYDAALAEAMLGHDATAIGLLEEALHHDPHFAAAAANLVALQLRRNDPAAARAAAERFMSIAPQSARAHYARALAALQSGDLATARADFGSLLSADPSYAIAHYDLALVELRAGNDGAARTELERALALAPGYARARFALGVTLMRSGDRTDAREAFERCAHDAANPSLRALADDLKTRLVEH